MGAKGVDAASVGGHDTVHRVIHVCSGLTVINGIVIDIIHRSDITRVQYSHSRGGGVDCPGVGHATPVHRCSRWDSKCKMVIPSYIIIAIAIVHCDSSILQLINKHCNQRSSIDLISLLIIQPYLQLSVIHRKRILTVTKCFVIRGNICF